MATWHAKPTYGYLKESTEAKENAELMYGIMNSFGYALESVAALLGNQAGESEYNPWRWQSEQILSTDSPLIGTIGGSSTQHAYGLFQQDPAAKYLHRSYAQSLPTFAPNYSNQSGQPYDGDAQMRYLHWICSDPNGGEWQSSGGWGATYKMSYYDFYTNSQNKSIDFLVRTFFYGYERGTETFNVRVPAAEYWYNYLSGITPPTPPTPPTPTGRKLPIYFYLRYPF